MKGDRLFLLKITIGQIHLLEKVTYYLLYVRNSIIIFGDTLFFVQNITAQCTLDKTRYSFSFLEQRGNKYN
jgi:hypothetical protein